jgi:hypothetical protein
VSRTVSGDEDTLPKGLSVIPRAAEDDIPANEQPVDAPDEKAAVAQADDAGEEPAAAAAARDRVGESLASAAISSVGSCGAG